MKTTINCFVLLWMFTSTVSLAQTEIPEKVRKAFDQKFPQATEVTWSAVENGRYEAEFIRKKDTMTARFDNNAKWLQSKTIINRKRSLPRLVRSVIEEAYPKSTYNWMEWVEQPERSFYRIRLTTSHEETEPLVIQVTKDGRMEKENQNNPD